jgi:hypothetical protein
MKLYTAINMYLKKGVVPLHARKALVGREGIAHTFLFTSALEGSEWSASRSGHI